MRGSYLNDPCRELRTGEPDDGPTRPAPGTRLLRRRGDTTWSSLVIEICTVQHRGGLEVEEVYALHESGLTFSWSPLSGWPGRWTVRVMEPAEPVVGNGPMSGKTPVEALRAAVERYRSPAWSAEVKLLERLEQGG